MSFYVSGVNCAAVTPVTAEGKPDLKRFGAHCRNLIDQGCHGIALMGTTGEANSFGLSERMAILDAAIAGGLEPAQLLPGTAACSVADTIDLTSHALKAGVHATVLLPPFYYKGVSDEGLFRFYAEVIDGVGDDALKVVLYHIPPISMIPISHALIARLREAFPGIIVGVKDSSGDIENMTAMARDFPGLAVLAGADPLLMPLLRAGGAGCITATSNLCADSLRTIYDNWRDPSKSDTVAAAQDRIHAWRTLSNRFVQLPTIKTMLAGRNGDENWLRVKPPLVPLSDTERKTVYAEMAKLA